MQWRAIIRLFGSLLLLYSFSFAPSLALFWRFSAWWGLALIALVIRKHLNS